MNDYGRGFVVSGDSARPEMPDKESLVRSCGLRHRISVFRK
jgi:hypothetical protein